MRVAGGRLVVERASSTVAVVRLDGSNLRQLAAAAGADVTAELDAGRDTVALGDLDEPLAVDEASALALGAWFDLGWRVLDRVLPAGASRLQLWPEHFDAGCDVAVGAGPHDRCNLGASPGDGPDGEPYLYVGPWGPDRPGDAAFWDAPFGATLRYEELRAAPDPVTAGEAFLRRGLSLLA